MNKPVISNVLLEKNVNSIYAKQDYLLNDSNLHYFNRIYSEWLVAENEGNIPACSRRCSLNEFMGLYVILALYRHSCETRLNSMAEVEKSWKNCFSPFEHKQTFCLWKEILIQFLLYTRQGETKATKRILLWLTIYLQHFSIYRVWRGLVLPQCWAEFGWQLPIAAVAFSTETENRVGEHKLRHENFTLTD